jgi:hypothetical protein
MSDYTEVAAASPRKRGEWENELLAMGRAIPVH